MRESNHDLAATVRADSKLLLHRRFIASRGENIKVAQNLATIDSHIKLTLARRSPGQLCPVKLERIGLARGQTGQGIGKCGTPAAGLIDSLRRGIADASGVNRGRSISKCVALAKACVSYEATSGTTRVNRCDQRSRSRCRRGGRTTGWLQNLDAADKGIVRASLREGNHDLTAAVSRDRKLLLQRLFVARLSKDIEVAQNRRAIDSYVE